ncbi:uncharacterized protein LOC131952481 [Physella acuta]|uniref:uncharacterized protein LOC131952481 n=1 Tax=Physella acuta TaxID=109671 RepID=UPI0027DB6307|nr:uncharacterized protein LOC131952481 [Physella acuta]
MATHARKWRLYSIVLFSILSTSVVRVNSLDQFDGTCGSVYDFMQTNTQSALLEVPMPESMAPYQDPSSDTRCDVIVTFPPGLNLLIELYFVDIIPQTADRKTCDTGLEIFDQMGRKYYAGRICGEAVEWSERMETSKRSVVIESSPLIFRLYSSGSYRGEGFRVHLNLFRPYWPCYGSEFKCQNIQRCVHDDLKCDGWDDCGDSSDEREEAGCTDTNRGVATPGADTNRGVATPGADTNRGVATPGADTNRGVATPGADTNRGVATPGADTNRGVATPGADTNRGVATPGADTNRGVATPGAQHLIWLLLLVIYTFM